MADRQRAHDEPVLEAPGRHLLGDLQRRVECPAARAVGDEFDTGDQAEAAKLTDQRMLPRRSCRHSWR